MADHDQREADAHLIAAAPELLVALEGWLAVVDENGRGNCCGCNYEEQAHLTRAAIAKATGPQAR